MSRRRASTARTTGRAPDALVFLVIVAGVWIAWQILRNALVMTAPPALAVRLGPDSPTVLTRAAEAELRAGRLDTARRYAQQALVRKPFNVPALRVAGLVAAREEDLEAADRMLTVAGNWSLRDDPAHSWLVGHRLRQEQSGSALAHADTLLRRRTDVYPRYFDLMIALVLRNDRQAQGALVTLLQRNPPWRLDFFIYALERQEGLPVAAALAGALKDGPHPMTEEERSRLYQTLIAQGRMAPLRLLMEQAGEGEKPTLSDGGFDQGGGPMPFHWKLPTSAGVLAEIAQGPDGQAALHAQVGQTAQRTIAEQLVLLTPGRWRISGRMRMEQGAAQALAWSLVCATGERELSSVALRADQDGDWAAFTGVLEVPQTCPAQQLRLTSLARDRGEALEFWVDDVTLSRAS